jgi:hypothetical protein
MNILEYDDWKQNEKPVLPRKFKARINKVEGENIEYVDLPRCQKLYTDGGNTIWNNLNKCEPAQVGDIVWVSTDITSNLYIKGKRHGENTKNSDLMFEPVYYAGNKSNSTSRFVT